MTSSGTYDFNPTLADLVIDAYERCGVMAEPLTVAHMQSARRSMNLVTAMWSTQGVNLWKVELVQTLMSQGQQSYAVAPDVVSVLDTYLRQYQMGAPVDVTPAFSTVSGSAVVTIDQPGSAAAAGAFIAIIIPVSVGGIVLQGFYQVQSVSSGSTYTIVAAQDATATVTQGGAVPVFATVAASNQVTVTLNNHGLLAGQNFTVQQLVNVGGITIQGDYAVTSITDANNFVITSVFSAGFSDAAAENEGSTQIAQQAVIQGYTQNADPIDILLYPLSRNDFAAIPDKLQQGRPTSYWFDRTLSPTLNIWQVPDGGGPYQLCYYVCRRIQDAAAEMGQTADVPFRFFEPFTAALAAHLAMKWAPDRAVALATYAAQMFTMAADDDREKVPTYFAPDLSGYFR
jgi:hypothetical protein